VTTNGEVHTNQEKENGVVIMKLDEEINENNALKSDEEPTTEDEIKSDYEKSEPSDSDSDDSKVIASPQPVAILPAQQAEEAPRSRWERLWTSWRRFVLPSYERVDTEAWKDEYHTLMELGSYPQTPCYSAPPSLSADMMFLRD